MVLVVIVVDATLAVFVAVAAVFVVVVVVVVVVCIVPTFITIDNVYSSSSHRFFCSFLPGHFIGKKSRHNILTS